MRKQIAISPLFLQRIYKPILQGLGCQYRGTTIKNFHMGVYMNINDAIIKRIEEICKEKNINVCEASLNSGKSPSAIYDLIKGRTKCSKVSTIKAFCQGAGITLSEFFDKDYFEDFEE